MATFKRFIAEKIVTKTGNDIVLYFETEQGSKYLLSSKNESKRIKSKHSNADDVGVKPWYDTCWFVNEKYKNELLGIQHLIGDEGFDIWITIKGSKAAPYYKNKEGKWQIATWDDAYPKSKKGAIPLAFDFDLQPKIGMTVVEMNRQSNGEISNYHVGSPVSKIKKISELSNDELLAFKDK